MESSTDEAEREATDERVCCPDDLCTGALDHEGRCGVCERVFAQYARSEPVTSAVEASEESEASEASEESAVSEDGEVESGAEYPSAYREAPPTEEIESERECCDDDLCTGALGPDGVCGTCGRSSIKLKSESKSDE